MTSLDTRAFKEIPDQDAPNKLCDTLRKQLIQISVLVASGMGGLSISHSAQAAGPPVESRESDSVATVDGPIRYRSSVEINPAEKENIKAIVGLMESEGIPAQLAVNLINFIDQAPIEKGLESDVFKSELVDRLKSLAAELHNEEEKAIWHTDLQETLQDYDVKTLIKTADLLIGYLKANGASPGRVQAAISMTKTAEKEHKNRPTEELRAKILAIKLLTKNQTAIENFAENTVQGTGEILFRIDWPTLAEKVGYKFEIYDPCLAEKFSGTVMKDGYYMDAYGERRRLQTIVDSAAHCAELQSTFISETPSGLTPRIGEGEPGKDTKLDCKRNTNLYLAFNGGFGVMTPKDPAIQDRKNPMRMYGGDARVGVSVCNVLEVDAGVKFAYVSGFPDNFAFASKKGGESTSVGPIIGARVALPHQVFPEDWKIAPYFAVGANVSFPINVIKDPFSNKVRAGVMGGPEVMAGAWIGQKRMFLLYVLAGWSNANGYPAQVGAPRGHASTDQSMLDYGVGTFEFGLRVVPGKKKRAGE